MNYIMNSLFTYGMSFTNYNVVNVNNIYNYMIYLLNSKSDIDTTEECLKNMKLLIGVNFFNNFIIYLKKKDPSNKILTLNI